MKKIICKTLIILILIVLLFEFVLSSNVTYASSLRLGAEKVLVNGITNLIGGIVSIVFWPERILTTAIALGVNFIVTQLANFDGKNSDYDGAANFLITPYEIFFNKYKILDVNFFDTKGLDEESATYKIRVSTAKWYYAIRVIASVILLVILIYIGIRMAISSVADDKAKYKKMFFDWLCSLALLFLMHYIIIFIVYGNSAIIKSLQAAFSEESSVSYVTLKIAAMSAFSVGISSITAMIVYIILTFQIIAFLIAYINRMLKVCFLIIVSPMITITYAIDKMNDGKAQAFGNWMREFIYTILIQPFHCVIYYAFGSVAFTLMTGETTNAGIIGNVIRYLGLDANYNMLISCFLAIFCLKFIKDGEKTVRTIFGFSDDNSKTSMAAGVAVGMAAINRATKIGTNAAKSYNSAKSSFKKFNKQLGKVPPEWSGAFNKMSNSFSNSKIGHGLSNIANSQKAQNAKSKARTMRNSVSNSAFGAATKSKVASLSNAVNNLNSNLKKGSNWANRKITGAKSKYGKLKNKLTQNRLGAYLFRRKHLQTAAAIMGTFAAYGSGASALEAIGVGDAVQNAVGQISNLTKSNIAESVADYIEEDEQNQYDELNEKLNKNREEQNNLNNSINNLLSEKGISEDELKNQLNIENNPHYQKAQRLQEMAEAIQDENDPQKRRLENQAEKERRRAENDIRRNKQKYKDITDMMDKRDKIKEEERNLQGRKDSFYTQEAAKERRRRGRNGAKATDIKNTMKEIQELLIKINKKKVRNSSLNHNISDDDIEESAVDTSEYIQHLLELAVHKHASHKDNFDTRELVSNIVGIADENDFNELCKNVDKLLQYKKQNAIKEAYKTYSGINGKEDDLDDELLKRLFSSNRYRKAN